MESPINVLVCDGELAARDANTGAAEASPQIFRIDLQHFVKKLDGTVGVAARPLNFTFGLEQLD